MRIGGFHSILEFLNDHDRRPLSAPYRGGQTGQIIGLADDEATTLIDADGGTLADLGAGAGVPVYPAGGVSGAIGRGGDQRVPRAHSWWRSKIQEIRSRQMKIRRRSSSKEIPAGELNREPQDAVGPARFNFKVTAMTRTFRPVTEWQRAWMRKCFAIIARMGTADHYVYAHHDQNAAYPYTLGEASPPRQSHRRQPPRVCAKKLGVDPDELTSTFIFRGLTRREARARWRTEFITEYGRQAEGGILINVAFGGNGPLSPEWLARMRAANRHAESRAKRSAVHKGKPKSPKHAARIAARNRSPERIAGVDRRARRPTRQLKLCSPSQGA